MPSASRPGEVKASFPSPLSRATNTCRASCDGYAHLMHLKASEPQEYGRLILTVICGLRRAMKPGPSEVLHEPSAFDLHSGQQKSGKLCTILPSTKNPGIRLSSRALLQALVYGFAFL